MSETTALALRSTSVITSFDDVQRAANAMSKSGYFQDSREAAQAIVKILAGREMGFGPFAAMTGIHIIQGRPSIGANLMAAAVKGSGRYNYRVTEMSDKACSIDFYEGREVIGNSTFTIEDARKAQTKNLDKFPKNMLFARAMSNGVRWYCPDVFNGSPVYTPEELGADVTEDGNVIPGSFSTPEPQPEQDAPFTPPTIDTPTMSLETAEAVTGSDGVRYGDATDEDLEGKRIGIQKAMKKTGLTIAQKEEYQLKLDAIATILASRK